MIIVGSGVVWQLFFLGLGGYCGLLFIFGRRGVNHGPNAGYRESFMGDIG